MIEGTNNWNQFSCLHSTMTDGFSFMAYSGSHKLKENENVNPGTKVEIKFPKDGSYFIVFHGRLVHNGASSVTAKDGTILNSARMFSYLRVPEHISQFNGNQRKSTRFKNYKTTLKEGKVDRATFGMLKSGPNTVINKPIELPGNSKYLQDHQVDIHPVIGNMNIDGWEVYNGVDFNSDKNKGFYNDLDELLAKKQNWNGISSTKRKMYMLYPSVECVRNGVMSKLRKLYNVFNEILEKKLRKIPYLSEVQLDSMAILSNFGSVLEQEPHRDFSFVKI